MLYLGIDAGGSATRWALVDASGAPDARGETRGLSGHVFNPAIRERTEAAIDVIAAAVGARGAIGAIHAGVTGLPHQAPEAEWLRRRLSQACGCPAERVALEDDVSLAYRASFAPGEGVVVYAGTGSIALHMTASGERWRAGGHGLLIDDEGSAVWIAREALRRLLTREDASPGAGWVTPLGAAFAARFGAAEWPAARAFVYGAERGALGQLARAVAEAARAGDAVAAATLNDAGAALARLATTLLTRTGRLPVALSGGALRLSPAIGETFKAMLGPASAVRVVDIDGALAAARLAAGATTRSA